MAWTGTTLPYPSMLENYACPTKDEVPVFSKKQHCSLQQNVHDTLRGFLCTGQGGQISSFGGPCFLTEAWSKVPVTGILG